MNHGTTEVRDTAKWPGARAIDGGTRMKHGIAPALVILAASFTLAGCSGSENQDQDNQPRSPATTQDQPQLFQDQINALDKAKGVEGTIQEGADRERKNIDQQSQ
jgi:outer membrane biogenesis lipoprotein LolB